MSNFFEAVLLKKCDGVITSYYAGSRLQLFLRYLMFFKKKVTFLAVFLEFLTFYNV